MSKNLKYSDLEKYKEENRSFVKTRHKKKQNKNKQKND